MSEGALILYVAADGAARIQLRAQEGTVWLSLMQISDLFGRDKSVISRHIKSVLEEAELDSDAVVAQHATTATDGKTYQVDHYRLEMILAVGYRVRGPRATQFRQWATTTLQQYLLKGFVMNDERLKDPRFDYFDELLERIRDIRASETRVYEKVREILALSPDYEPKGTAAHTFYATIQNKMLHAVTGETAAALIVARANPAVPNMGLTTWKGDRVRKTDVGTAKNYLAEAEIKELNLIVTMFLDTAELRSLRRQQILLVEWEGILDAFLINNELLVLRDAGRVSAEQAAQIANERYAAFDDARKAAQRITSEQADELVELQHIADTIKEQTKLRGAKAKKGKTS